MSNNQAIQSRDNISQDLTEEQRHTISDRLLPKENSSDTVDLDNNSGDMQRDPMATSAKSPVYNRFKYYSALRTGFQ